MESERQADEADEAARRSTSATRSRLTTPSAGDALAAGRSHAGAAALSPRGAGGGVCAAAVLALQGSAGNRWVARELVRERTEAARWLLRDPTAAGTSAAGGSTTASSQSALAAFAATVARRFAVKDVHVGTQAEQRTAVTPGGALGSAPAAATLPNWRPWEPDKDTYPEIIGAFDDAAKAFGGLPKVDTIVFYEVDYVWDAQSGSFVPQSGTGASFSAGRLTVYHTASKRSTMLPVARSDASAKYPAVTIGDRPQGGAPRRYASPAESTRRVIVHELGHGIQEAVIGGAAMSGPDPKMMADFALAVGWWPGGAGAGAPRLYDIQDPAVGASIGQQQTPTAAPITDADWNDPKWHEQPISGYSLSGPFEDFAESVMAYVYAPAVLKARSPARWGFLDGRKTKWKTAFQQPPP